MDDKHAKIVCGLGSGDTTCSFLVVGAKGFECAKGTTVEFTIEQRRAAGTMNAMGDHCSGPPNYTLIATDE